MSNNNLLFFLLPRWIRLWRRKESLVKVDTKFYDKKKLNEVYELLDNAMPRYVYENNITGGTIFGIRLTTKNDDPKSDQCGKRFITIFGGIEDLIIEFPRAWGVSSSIVSSLVID
jgi:hypothetical protein